MHSYFIDTSALFKRYVEEQGSEVVDSIFSESAEKHISTISILELLSNLQRLHLIDKIMSSSQFTAAWTAFSLDPGRRHSADSERSGPNDQSCSGLPASLLSHPLTLSNWPQPNHWVMSS